MPHAESTVKVFKKETLPVTFLALLATIDCQWAHLAAVKIAIRLETVCQDETRKR